jgi:hypothetical protein
MDRQNGALTVKSGDGQWRCGTAQSHQKPVSIIEQWTYNNQFGIRRTIVYFG